MVKDSPPVVRPGSAQEFQLDALPLYPRQGMTPRPARQQHRGTSRLDLAMGHSTRPRGAGPDTGRACLRPRSSEPGPARCSAVTAELFAAVVGLANDRAADGGRVAGAEAEDAENVADPDRRRDTRTYVVTVQQIDTAEIDESALGAYSKGLAGWVPRVAGIGGGVGKANGLSASMQAMSAANVIPAFFNTVSPEMVGRAGLMGT